MPRSRGYLEQLVASAGPVSALRTPRQLDWGPTRLPEPLLSEPVELPARPVSRQRTTPRPPAAIVEPRVEPLQPESTNPSGVLSPPPRLRSVPPVAEPPVVHHPEQARISAPEKAVPVVAPRPAPEPSVRSTAEPARPTPEATVVSQPPEVTLPSIRPLPGQELALERLEALSRRFGSSFATPAPPPAALAEATPPPPATAAVRDERPLPITLPALPEPRPPAPRLEIGRIEVFVAAAPAPPPAPVAVPSAPVTGRPTSPPPARLSRPGVTYGFGQG
ncbi:MAG: hypothetical protein IPL43_10505 [Micropruina sp.]|nr:hypothetical protein [Micropruina sp.]